MSGSTVHEVRHGSYYPERSFEVLASCGERFQLLSGAAHVAGHTQAAWCYDDATCSECVRHASKTTKVSGDGDQREV